MVALAGAALEQEGIDHAIEHRGLSDQILGQRSTASVGETDQPFAIVVRENDAARARELIDALMHQSPLPSPEPTRQPPVPAPPPSADADVALYDSATGAHVGSLSRAQLAQMAAHLER